jgi:hypothetical protein
VGALAHYLESEGIPTTQISLIREHTAIIKPPRALWVSFELGRPLGLPDDPSFQRRVLLAALELFNAGKGPVLADYPEDVPEKKDTLQEDMFAQAACPVSFTVSTKGQTDTEKLLSSLKREVAELRSWYDLSLEKRGYSAVAYFTPETASQLLSDFVLNMPLQLPESIPSPAVALRFATQDLKAFYFESLLSRPDTILPDTPGFNKWFWGKNTIGKVLKLVKETCLSSNDEHLRMTGGLLLVPMGQS